MAEQATEIVDGPKLLSMLHSLIESRRICKMAITRTAHAWVTILLEIKEGPPQPTLMIDGVGEFEKVFSRFRGRAISFEFFDINGVPCRFQTRVIQTHPKAIEMELPPEIHRIQKRAFFRLEASLGMELTFQDPQGQEEKARVHDYSLGGIAFFTDSPVRLQVDDLLRNIQLKLPQEKKGWVAIQIPLAVVKRIEPQSEEGRLMGALEILEISDAMREQLRIYMFEEQRSLIRKVRKTSPPGRIH
jgi:c-di-GMP-binding flagellar brake protein YcgR